MAEKFTAMQWAAIEGGHTMEPEVEEQKPFSFIKDMQEARLTRGQDSNRILTYTDCCERLYLSILMLEAMRQYPGYTGQVKRYAKMSNLHHLCIPERICSLNCIPLIYKNFK